MAWNATWASSAQAWMQMSPPVNVGSRASPGKAGRSISAAGRVAANPNRSSKSDGPNPTVRVRRDGCRSRASPVSAGGAKDPPGPVRGRPVVNCSAASDHSASSAARPARPAAVTSKVAKTILACSGVAIPAWWAPWKGRATPESSGAAAASVDPVAAAATTAAVASPEVAKRWRRLNVGPRRSVMTVPPRCRRG